MSRRPGLGILTSVLLIALLTSCSQDTERQPEGRGAGSKPTPTVEATVEQVQDLIRNRDDQALVRMLCETSDWDVMQQILYYFKRSTDGGDLKLFRKSEAEIVRRRGQFFVADVYLCRGEKRGLFLMGEAYRAFEKDQDMSELDRERLLSAVRAYLRAATGIGLETAEAYMQWVEQNSSDITIEPSPMYPRIKVKSKEGSPGR